MGQIWALSVGINAYDTKPLRGCINDVTRFADWLLKAMPAGTVNHQKLHDAEATRAAVMEGFSRHLGQAGPGDVALFHFAGHGRQSLQAVEFNQFDTSRAEEGLVLWDSQGPTAFDLADKEMALLIDDVAKGGAEVVIILDCCHSGSATRSAADPSEFTTRALLAREGPNSPYKRTLADYAGGRYVERAKLFGAPRIPLARHVALAACSRHQEAKERGGNGTFTSALLNVLEPTGGRLSYAELFQKMRTAVQLKEADQDPQIEDHGGFDCWSGFLGSTASRAETRWNTRFRGGRWEVEAGAVHGLSTAPGQPGVLRLYDGKTYVGTARIVSLGAQISEITPDFAADPTRNYAAIAGTSHAIATDLPPALVDELQAILAADFSIGVQLSPADADTRQRLFLADGAVCLAHVEGPVLWRVLPKPGWTTALAAQLKALANWQRLISFDNPATKLDRSLFEVQLLSGGEDGLKTVHPGRFARLDITQEQDGWQKPPVAVRVRNRKDQPLFACLLWFSDKLGIIKLDNREINTSDDWTIFWQGQRLVLDDGDNETEFRFRLIIATEQIDDMLLTQGDIQWPGRPAPYDPALATRGGMEPLTPKKMPLSNEFYCIDLGFILIRQQAKLGTAATLADGLITIASHPTLAGQIALSKPVQPTRALGRDGGEGNSVVTGVMAKAGISLATTGSSRSADGAGDGIVLDLSGISGQQGLTAAEPLVITARLPLGTDEQLLPLLFDGEDLLPPGMVETTEDGACRISLDHLPEPNTRSLGSAVKLYFFKTVMGKHTATKLRRVDVSGPKPVYHDIDKLTVAPDTRVLLIIHGIIGETISIAEGVIAAELGAHFPLVLAFDYENLNTPIAETANELKQQLESVGIGAADGPRLTILAHSMGGLVSRAMIELKGGHAMVDHLVMCGTPNGGSPFGNWGQARQVINLLMGFAGNQVPTLLPWTVPLAWLLDKSKLLTLTLEQMKPGSPFLKSLDEAGDPHVRYTVLAGSIDACSAAGDDLSSRLLFKLGQSTPVDLLFGLAPHDLATTLHSSKSMPTARQPSVATGEPLACHHLNYFASPAGLAALRLVSW